MLAAAVRAALAGRLDELLDRWDASRAAVGYAGLGGIAGIGSGGLAPAGPSLALAIDLCAGHRRPRPRPRATPAGSPAPSPAAGRASDPEADPAAEPGPDLPAADGEVRADHAETWQLVARAQAGDAEAFGELYDRYVDTVYRFVYFRVNDRALAEDFTSETFLRALRRIGTISYQGRDIGAWFVTIARNIVFDHAKSARNRFEIVTGDPIESDRYERSTESAVIESLTSQRLMAALQQLGDEQRECLTLRFIQGFSVSEAAAVMGKNDGAIKALQHRAVRRLADLVAAELR